MFKFICQTKCHNLNADMMANVGNLFTLKIIMIGSINITFAPVKKTPL